MLWFKNLMVYRLSRDIELRAEEMEKQLAELTFTPCGSQDMAKTGWVSPMGSHSDALTHTANGQIIICARKEEKILPSPVIKQALEAKIQKLEADQGRKLKKTEKDSLKDEVLHSLLPRAFSRFSQTMMWIDTVNGLIMVDCASAKKAEDTLALLRKTLGSLPVVPLTLENPIELTLTEWVRSGTVAQGFQLLDEAELKANANSKKAHRSELFCIEMAGVRGFEPRNAGIRIRCLTAWRYPNKLFRNYRCVSIRPEYGGYDGIRTCDPIIMSDVL